MQQQPEKHKTENADRIPFGKGEELILTPWHTESL